MFYKATSTTYPNYKKNILLNQIRVVGSNNRLNGEIYFCLEFHYDDKYVTNIRFINRQEASNGKNYSDKKLICKDGKLYIQDGKYDRPFDIVKHIMWLLYKEQIDNKIKKRASNEPDSHQKYDSRNIDLIDRTSFFVEPTKTGYKNNKNDNIYVVAEYKEDKKTVKTHTYLKGGEVRAIIKYKKNIPMEVELRNPIVLTYAKETTFLDGLEIKKISSLEQSIEQYVFSYDTNGSPYFTRTTVTPCTTSTKDPVKYTIDSHDITNEDIKTYLEKYFKIICGLYGIEVNENNPVGLSKVSNITCQRIDGVIKLISSILEAKGIESPFSVKDSSSAQEDTKPETPIAEDTAKKDTEADKPIAEDTESKPPPKENTPETSYVTIQELRILFTSMKVKEVLARSGFEPNPYPYSKDDIRNFKIEKLNTYLDTINKIILKSESTELKNPNTNTGINEIIGAFTNEELNYLITEIEKELAALSQQQTAIDNAFKTSQLYQKQKAAQKAAERLLSDKVYS